MDDPLPVLKWSLLGGAMYFLFVAAAHFFQIKLPLLYVYYDLPSTMYQDKIISFAMLGWAFFYVAGYSSLKRNSLRSVRYIVFAGAGAVAQLSMLNAFTDFSAIAPVSHVVIYWIETAALAAFLGWIAFLYKWAKKLADYHSYSSR
jgi:hypothetical protein